MRNLKLRFKRTLFAFFKEEILKEVGYQDQKKKLSPDPFIVKNKPIYMNVDELRFEIILDESRHLHIPPDIMFNDAVERMKKEMFKEVLKLVVINKEDILNPDIYNRSRVRCSLFVAKDQNSLIRR